MSVYCVGFKHFQFSHWLREERAIDKSDGIPTNPCLVGVLHPFFCLCVCPMMSVKNNEEGDGRSFFSNT